MIHNYTYQTRRKPPMNRQTLINACLYAALLLAIVAIFYYGGQ